MYLLANPGRVLILPFAVWLIQVTILLVCSLVSVHAQTRNDLDVLSYNIYLRPTILWNDGQMIRAGILPNVLSGYDVIVFQEAFDDRAREKLISGLASEYPYRTQVTGRDEFLSQDGGVFLVSKWPIEYESQRLFDTCAGWDCESQKGVVYALINKDGRCYHVFGAHTQAGDQQWQRRMQQFQTIRQFVHQAYIRKDEPVIIAGDLNEDRFFGKYIEMLDTLWAGHPMTTGPTYTFDSQTNDLNDSGEFHYYDYVLISRSHLQPLTAANEVKILRSAAPWRGGFTGNYDLSDHYAVLGEFTFPQAAADLPCPSAGAFRAMHIVGPEVVQPGEEYTLRVQKVGGGPNWTYLWNNGAITPSVSGTLVDHGDRDFWSVEVTDQTDGSTRWDGHSVHVEDPEARALCLERCESEREACRQEEPPRIGGCNPPYSGCARTCELQF